MRVRGLETVDGMAVTRMVAVPDAGSRVGGFVRFLLYEDAKHERRAGSVDAEVHVTAPHLRARRALPHRTTLEPARPGARDRRRRPHAAGSAAG